jgi:proteasome accessory factor C
VYTPRSDDTRVTLELAPAAAWVAESYPTEAVTERADGSLEIVLAVSERAWLERLLVRLGPDARVVAPPEFASLAADAATRTLRRYQESERPEAAAHARNRRADPRARGRA